MNSNIIRAKKIFFALFLFQVALSIQSYVHKTITAKSLIEVEEAVKQHVENTLILVDLDNTLIMPEDCVLRDSNIKPQKEFIEFIYTEQNSSHLMKSLFADMHWRLLDTRWYNFFDFCKERAYAIYGFTARHLGKLEWQLFANSTIFDRPFVEQDTHEDYTIRSLHKLNIHFDQSDINWFRFKQGVIFCDPLTKGEVLKEFLKKINVSFDAIIFIDDRDCNLESVSQAIKEWNALKNSNLSFIGIHYIAIDLIDHSIDEKVVAQQLKHLVEYRKYISEKEASCFLKSKN